MTDLLKDRFTPATLKAISAYQAAENGPAWKRAVAYVVIPPARMYDDTTRHIGKIKIALPADGAGPLKVWVWDCANSDVQYGTASGYGYDKLSAAMVGMFFDGVKLTDHPRNWESQLRELGYTVVQAI